MALLGVGIVGSKRSKIDFFFLFFFKMSFGTVFAKILLTGHFIHLYTFYRE
jgi:hypothetical protein